MRRFDQADLFDRMAEEGRLPLALMPRLATAIAVFHESANRVLTPKQSVAALREVARDNEDTLSMQHGVIDAVPARGNRPELEEARQAQARSVPNSPTSVRAKEKRQAEKDRPANARGKTVRFC